MLITVSYLFWKCLFFPGSDLSKKVINRSLNGVSNTQGKPINITVIEPTMMSVNQCAPIITLGNAKTTKIIRAVTCTLKRKTLRHRTVVLS
jgi:hypothetical protein